MIFGADEAMLETLLGTKVVVPEGTDEAIAAEVEGFPHISVMCCHSIYGEVMPPFMIIPTIRNLPPELKIFADSGQLDISCAPAGYMNRDAFLLWTITFINHLSVYRLKLPASIMNSRAALILDGHSSRACPLALWLLDKANVEVIIEPSNTSHVIQMFDVCLANPFKTSFRQIFHRLEKKDQTQFSSIIARLRNHAAQAIISSWASASGIVNRISSGRKTGISPFDPQAIFDSPFIIQLNEQQQARQARRDARRNAGLNINCKILTSPEMMGTIKAKVEEQQRYQHLCMIPPRFRTYSELIRHFSGHMNNGAKILSQIPPICYATIVPEMT